MAKIVEASSISQELHLHFQISGVDFLVISGYAFFLWQTGDNPLPSQIQGDPDNDHKSVEYEARMLIGPDWEAIRDVSAVVSRAGYFHFSPDSADAGGYDITLCDWKGVDSSSASYERVELRVSLSLAGGVDSYINSLAYQAVVEGKLGPGYTDKSGLQSYQPATPP